MANLALLADILIVLGFMKQSTILDQIVSTTGVSPCSIKAPTALMKAVLLDW